MNLLKENEEKRSRKEERENRLLRRTRELAEFDSVEVLPSAFERGITRRDLVNAAIQLEMSAAEVMAWQRYMDFNEWRSKDGLPVTGRGFRRPLRMWHLKQAEIDARKERRGSSAEREAEKRKAAERAKEAERVKLAAEPGAWELCWQRCKHAKAGGGCAAKCPFPPTLALPRPRPPEDCKGFEPKEVA